MKAGRIIAGATLVAVLAGGGGFYGGMKYSVHSMIDGGKYVYSIKSMPPKTVDVPVSKDALPRANPWQTAHFHAQSYCMLVEEASGAAPERCEPFLAELER